MAGLILGTGYCFSSISSFSHTVSNDGGEKVFPTRNSLDCEGCFTVSEAIFDLYYINVVCRDSVYTMAF